MWFCESCRKDRNIDTKSSHINLPHIWKMKLFLEKILTLQIKLTDTYINPDVEQIDNLIKRAIEECTQHFHRFIFK